MQRLLRHGGDDLGAVVWHHRLDELLAQRDAPLRAHLRAVSPDLDLVSMGTYRWFVVLLAREFAVADVQRVWDLLLGDASRFDALLYAAFAMLSLIRGRLLAANDVNDCIDLLANFPADIPIETVLRRTHDVLNNTFSLKLSLASKMDEYR